MDAESNHLAPELTRELYCHGWVTHSRTHPVKHQFTYRVWMLLVDLDGSMRQRPMRGAGPSRSAAEGSFLARGSPSRSPAEGSWPRWLVSWDREHLLGRSEIVRTLRDAGFDAPPTRIFALTQPRSAGFSFNPVNFYFCLSDGVCQAILSDVRNTPWNEKHCYVLDARGQRGEYIFEPRKSLHVSPFLPMQGKYRWRVRLTAERIEVTMHFDPHGRPAFMAKLSLRAEPLTKRAVLRALVRAPAQNLATLMRVYRQAGRLYLKGAPFHSHPRDGVS